jgi:hypothetical protein
VLLAELCGFLTVSRKDIGELLRGTNGFRFAAGTTAPNLLRRVGGGGDTDIASRKDARTQRGKSIDDQ